MLRCLIVIEKSTYFQGAHVTSYPSFKKELESSYKYDDHARVVVDGNVITSRGPGTALVSIYSRITLHWSLAISYTHIHIKGYFSKTREIPGYILGTKEVSNVIF
jgi:hypothetical protein